MPIMKMDELVENQEISSYICEFQQSSYKLPVNCNCRTRTIERKQSHRTWVPKSSRMALD